MENWHILAIRIVDGRRCLVCEPDCARTSSVFGDWARTDASFETSASVIKARRLQSARDYLRPGLIPNELNTNEIKKKKDTRRPFGIRTEPVMRSNRFGLHVCDRPGFEKTSFPFLITCASNSSVNNTHRALEKLLGTKWKFDFMHTL